jgi:hypothetical protein
MTDKTDSTSERVAGWLTGVMSRASVERPLRLAVPGASNTAKGLAHVYNERHDEELSVQQMAQALATLRDRDDAPVKVEGVTEFVDTGNPFSDGLARWRVEA